MPKKPSASSLTKRPREDENIQSNDTRSTNLSAAESHHIVKQDHSISHPASFDTTGENHAMVVTLTRTDMCSDRWRSLHQQHLHRSRPVLAAAATMFYPDRDPARNDTVAMSFARSLSTVLVGTIELIFNDHRSALLVEYGDSLSAALPAGGVEWCVGDVIAFTPSTSAPENDAGEAVWIGYNVAAAVTPSDDRIDVALRILTARLLPHALRVFSAKPGVAQLTAATDDAVEWCRLLHIADVFIAGQVGASNTKDQNFGLRLLHAVKKSYAKQHAGAEAERLPASVCEVLSHLHVLGFLVASAVVSLHDSCGGVNFEVQRLTWEFIASPLFLVYAACEFASPPKRSDGGSSHIYADRFPAILTALSESTWLPYTAIRLAYSPLADLWSRAATALGTALYMGAHEWRLQRTQQEGSANSVSTRPQSSEDESTSGGWSHAMHYACRYFAAWVISSSARGTMFAANLHRDAPYVLDAYLNPPTWAQLVSQPSDSPYAAVSGSRGADVKTPQQLEHLLRLHLPTLAVCSHIATQASHVDVATTPLLSSQSMRLMPLVALRRHYCALYLPLAKSLRRRLVERGALAEVAEYEFLSDAWLPICRARRTTESGSVSRGPLRREETQARTSFSVLDATGVLRSLPLSLSVCVQESTLVSSVFDSRQANVMSSIVIEMDEISEPFVFFAVCHRTPATLDNVTLSTAELVVQFVGDTDDSACALLLAVLDAAPEGSQRKDATDSSSAAYYPRAWLVLAQDRSAVAADAAADGLSRLTAIGNMQALETLVVQLEQKEITEQFGLGVNSSSSTATPPPVSKSLYDYCCFTSATHVPVVSSHRVLSAAERDALHRAVQDVCACGADSAAHSGALQQRRTAVAECVINALSGGACGLHVIEGVSGSGKSLASAMVSAAHGVARSAARSEVQLSQAHILEHISERAMSTAAIVTRTLQQSSLQVSGAYASFASSKQWTAALESMAVSRQQQEEEYERCRKALFQRSPVLLIESDSARSSSCLASSSLLFHLTCVRGAKGTDDDVRDLRTVTLHQLREAGLQRALRAPYVQRLLQQEASLWRLWKWLEASEVAAAALCRVADDDGDATDESHLLYPTVLAAALWSYPGGGMSSQLLPRSCNGNFLFDSLRVVFGTDHVLQPEGPVAEAACRSAASAPPSALLLPHRYRMSHVAKRRVEDVVRDAAALGRAVNVDSLWKNTTAHRECLGELQLQTIRATMHSIYQELTAVTKKLQEFSDFVAAFDAQQRDVVVCTDLDVLEHRRLLQCKVGPRTTRGALDLSAVVMDNMEWIQDSAFFTVGAPSHLVTTHSLERIASAEVEELWGIGAAMSEHVRQTAASGGAAAGAASSQPTDVPTTTARLMESLRFQNQQLAISTTMTLPPSVLKNRKSVMVSCAVDMAEADVAKWTSNVWLWTPSSIRAGSAMESMLLSLQVRPDDTADASGAASAKRLLLYDTLPTPACGDMALALLLAEETCDGDNAEVREEQKKNATLAIVVPWAAAPQVQESLAYCKERVFGGDDRRWALLMSVVTIGDLQTLAGCVFDVLVVVPVHASALQGMWLWRAVVRATKGFAVICSSGSFGTTSNKGVPTAQHQPLQILRNCLSDMKASRRDQLVASGAALGTQEHRLLQLSVASAQRSLQFDAVQLRCSNHRGVVSALTAHHCAPPSAGGARAQHGYLAVAHVGSLTCRTICMQRFASCDHPAHRCIRPCHCRHPHVADSNEQSVRDHHGGEHASCPYPCPRILPCGHRCLGLCGEPCGPCSFTGWVELPCGGQRVVCGIIGKEVQYYTFPHLQRVACGESPKACNEMVSTSCPQCGSKIEVPCCEMGAVGETRTAAAGEDEESTAPTTTTCALLNAAATCKVCATAAQGVQNEFHLEAGSSSDWSAWPQEAREKLQKHLSFLRQKHGLLEKRLALEMSAKGVERNPEYVAQEERMRQFKESQEAEEAEYARISTEHKAKWAEDMKSALAAQQQWNDAAELNSRVLIEWLLRAD